MIERFAAHDLRAGGTDATRDLLTGALNRHGLTALIDRIAGSARRGRGITLLMVDVDGLASVDSDYGERAGDEVRVTIAHRLRLFVAPHDSVARVARNVFACILCQGPDSPIAIDMTKEMLAAIAWPVDVPGGTVMLRGAAGIAAATAGARTAERQLAAARVAMEWVVARGHGGHCVYEPGVDPAGFHEAIDGDCAQALVQAAHHTRPIEPAHSSRAA